MFLATKNKNRSAKKEKKRIPKTVQQTIPYVQALDEGIIEVKKGYYSKTIEFQDINYQTARQEDQESIFMRYGQFLNYFSPSIGLQITINNKSIDRKTLEDNVLLKYKNDDLDTYREEYNNMLKRQVSEGRNDIRKERYLTITVEATNRNDARSMLLRLESEAQANLKKLGSNTKTLSTDRRLEILHDFYRNGNEGQFQLDFEQLKKQGITTKDIIAPDSFEFKRNYFMMGEKYGRALYVSSLSSYLSDVFINEISDFSFNEMVTFNIRSVAPDEALKKVKRQLSNMDSEKMEKQKNASKGGFDPNMIPSELKYSIEEAQELLEDLRNRNQKMFLVNIAIVHIADTMDDLNKDTEMIQATARKHMCQIGILNYQQEDALASVLPLGNNRLYVTRTLTTESTAIFMPFNSQELIQANGMYYGLNAVSRNLIMFSRKSLKTPNGFILGTPGSGKSFAAKREMVNVLLNTDDDVVIIDPEREYSPLALGFRGQIVHISAGSKNHINPLDMSKDYADDDDPVMLKSEFVLSLCECLVGGKDGLSAAQKTIIDRCVKKIYEKFIHTDSDVDMPTLLDFQSEVEKQPEEAAKELALSLELYTRGSLSTFSNKTNIDINNRFIIYDIKDLGKQLKTIGLLIVLDAVWNRITKNRAEGKNTWIYIDEIYLLFKNEYSANFLFELYKRARKWGGIPTGITQNVEDLLQSDLARTMLSNSDFIMMLNQAPTDRKELVKLLNISETLIGYVTNSEAGQGLIFSGDSIIPFIDQFPTNTKLYSMMTTKVGEVINTQEETKFVFKV